MGKLANSSFICFKWALIEQISLLACFLTFFVHYVLIVILNPYKTIKHDD